MTRTRSRRLAFLLLLPLLLLPACRSGDDGGTDAAAPAPGQSATIPPGRLSIATGGTGGVYFVYGGGIAREITSTIKGIEATAEVTSASVDNFKLIANGSSDLAFSLADTASDAVTGKGSFTTPIDARAIARLYDNYTQVVAKAGGGINSVRDMRGKRVSVGAPNSGTEVIAVRLLEVAGLDARNDIRRQQLGVAESVAALRDGTIDAFFWSGGLPTGSLTDLSSNTAITILPLAELLEPMRQRFGPFYSAGTIPANTYRNAAPVETISVPNYLVAKRDMNPELAYQVTKLLFDRQQQLIAVHPEAKNLKRETANQVAPMQLHPGAQRYYDGK